MKILDSVYLVGGGRQGIGISNRFDSHVYLIDGGEESALIDAGVGIETERILENINKERLSTSKTCKLLLTHAHADHAGGAANLKEMLNLEIYLSEEEAAYLETGDEDALGLELAKKLGYYPQDYKLRAAKVDHTLRGGERIQVGRYSLEVISTPGHSTGSICFLLVSGQKRALFAGDTVFMGGLINVLNYPGSSLADYRKGIKNLADLSVDSLLPGHFSFTLSDGQSHIDMAIEALRGLLVPKMVL